MVKLGYLTQNILDLVIQFMDNKLSKFLNFF